MNEDKVAPNIIDNTPGRELEKVIKDQLKKSVEAKFAIGYFFLSGFSLVREDFPSNYATLPFLKIVMGNETTYPTKEELVAGYSLRELFKQRMIEDLQGVELTEEQIRQLERLRDFVARKVVDVKLFDKSRLHAKLYLFLTKPEEEYGSPGLGVVGSSNFTAEGLTRNKELNVLLTSREEVLYLNQWFDKLWDEAVEFREDLLKVIEISGVLPGSPYPKIGKLIDPQTLFKYLVYKWFGGRVLSLLKRDVLMEFQLVGVVNAVNIVEAYKGVIIADSVGLGKSFIASAIVEEFLCGKHPNWTPEGKLPSVLLILPPSLIPQWEEILIGKMNNEIRDNLARGAKIKVPPMFEEEGKGFLVSNYKRLIKNDNNNKVYEIYDECGQKLLGKIGFLSLGIFQGYKVDNQKNIVHPEIIRLAEEYDLFVVDEAHKYRNRNTNRWRALNRLQKKENNFWNRFLLLTATPLNNSINDIYNLIRIFSDETFRPFTIRSIPITELMKEYRTLKKELRKKDDDRTRKKLKRVATKIKQKVLDEIMVLRTRKYIMEQFREIKVNGNPLVFKDPEPYSLDYTPFSTKDYQALIKTIGENLEGIQFEFTKLYGVVFIMLEEDEIEEKEPVRRPIEISYLFKLLLGKRLESGIYPFETTLRRVYEKERVFYELLTDRMDEVSDLGQLRDLIECGIKKARIDKELGEIQEEYEVEEGDEKTRFDRVVKILAAYAELAAEEDRKYEVIEFLKLGLKKLLENIENDLRLMDNIFVGLDRLKEKQNGGYKIVGKVPRQMEDIIDLPIYSYSNDPKLESLKQLIGNPAFKSRRLKNIPSLNRKKILIFTQYKDTAYYIYHNLRSWIENETDIHSWLRDKHGRIKIGLVTGETETSTKMNFIKRFAARANSGFEEVSRFGDIEILISTDALSEGVNLQDADAVVNYDLPWNPMIIVQRVGRVNRIGNDKDVCVINYVPSDEIEIIVGVLNKLKEKIKDITLIVGKDVKILTPEEEISIETFGEHIKDISKKSIADLERYSISEDFKQFIPEGISREQFDDYKLLAMIQYDLGYTKDDFMDVIGMEDGPYYSFISGGDKVVSVYEFYRGGEIIMRKALSRGSDGTLEETTPLAFLDLIKRKEVSPQKIEKAIESLKEMSDKTEAEVERLKEGYRMEQRGFLYNLYNALLVERAKAEGIADKFKVVMNTLQVIPYYSYSREIKPFLFSKNLIEDVKNGVILKDFRGVVEALYEFFKERKLTDIESLKITVKHVGWYHEV